MWRRIAFLQNCWIDDIAYQFHRGNNYWSLSVLHLAVCCCYLASVAAGLRFAWIIHARNGGVCCSLIYINCSSKQTGGCCCPQHINTAKRKAIQSEGLTDKISVTAVRFVDISHSRGACFGKEIFCFVNVFISPTFSCCLDDLLSNSYRFVLFVFHGCIWY